ncbi:hypothetical protein L211DRAFT_850010 [Terfezia boudieri ATCC MYA-4762]|uniref:Uncharacterized protein n=1 Tax=Terfezia boudieri ATCC MYA-4762 TaxID=1051890 RepID=A0A3N4LY52_9PEZI|nr:hypothetical protein L211DRAFT_850010 [Terfezia boudieri ATCC MYA-4762]
MDPWHQTSNSMMIHGGIVETLKWHYFAFCTGLQFSCSRKDLAVLLQLSQTSPVFSTKKMVPMHTQSGRAPTGTPTKIYPVQLAIDWLYQPLYQIPPKRKLQDNEDSEDDHHVTQSNHGHAKLVGIFEEEVPENLVAVIRDKAAKAAREAHAAKYPDDFSLPILDKALQWKGVKGKQEDDWGEDKNEDEDEDAEEPRQTLKGPKRIMGGSKGIGYLKPVLKGDKGIVGVLHIKEDNEEEEEDAPKNIKTRSGTGSIGGGKGIVRPQGIRTSRKVLHIEEDDEGEEEEAPRNIKTRSGTGSVGGGKGIVRPQGTRISKKVVIIEEEMEGDV